MGLVNFLMVFTLIVSTLMVSAPKVSAAAVYVTDSGSTLVVNTGSGLIYTINKANGDMVSCKLNGTELTGTKPSHINSGLGSANVTWSRSPSGSTLVITVDAGLNTLLCVPWR